ncbi:MAG: carboxypeptidase regulatory-like domain-containing protein, partial [Parafilimonas sp.]|nr:carboxypeptidase regulatory-like domain-containing protein [Parafilimonas sp.]
MKKIYFIIFIAASAYILSCKKETIAVSSPVYNQSIAHQTGVVTGKATDSYGNVLKNVNVTAEHTVWLGTYLYATTNAHGKYSITIPNDPAGDWVATARYTKKAYGQTYIFDMNGNQTPFSQSDAAVRNFTWKLSGKKPGNNGYYGAHVDLYQF